MVIPEDGYRCADRVALATEAEHGAPPDRVGVVIDTSTVDLDGAQVLLVDFPWCDRYMTLPPTALELVERPVDAEPPPAIMAAAQRALEAVEGSGVHVELVGPDGLLHAVVAGVEGQAMSPPEDVGAHVFTGRSDRDCELPGCGKPDRNPIHDVTPPYRLRHLDELLVGDEVWMGGHPWVRCRVLSTREAGGYAYLIVLDGDGDERPLIGVGPTPVPCPLGA